MTNVIELAKQSVFNLDGMQNMLYTVRGNYAQLELYTKLVRNAALEQCLEIADQCADADMHASMAANAIRNLKEPTP